jgi:hypothetical protein
MKNGEIDMEKTDNIKFGYLPEGIDEFFFTSIVAITIIWSLLSLFLK